MTAQPWFKWYPNDWRSDAALRMCGLAARGLWIELLGYAHQGEPYGHVTINGQAPSLQDIAALVGAPIGVVRKAIEELEQRGVFSRDAEGRIYSRKMVRDKERSDQGKAYGSTGGNPALKGRGKPNPPTLGVNPPRSTQNQNQNQKLEPERSDETPGLPVGPAQAPASHFKPAGEPGLFQATQATPEPSTRATELLAGNAPRPRVARRLPDHWPLTPLLETVAGIVRSDAGLPPIDVTTEHAKFCDYWHAKSGKDATKTDWLATWRNWIRNAHAPRARPNGEAFGSGMRGQIADAMSMIDDDTQEARPWPALPAN